MVSQGNMQPMMMQRMPGQPQPGQLQPGAVNLPPRYATPKTDGAGNVAGGTVVQVSQQGPQGQVMHLQVANAQPQSPQQNAGPGQNVPPPNIMAPPLPPQQQQQQQPGNANGELPLLYACLVSFKCYDRIALLTLSLIYSSDNLFSIFENISRTGGPFRSVKPSR